MSLDPDDFYADLRDTVATPLLQQYGFPMAIWVKSSDDYDPVTGTVTGTPVYGVNPATALYGGGVRGRYPGVSTDTEGNTLTRKTSRDAFVEATSLQIVPAPDDLFQDENGFLSEILSVSDINPGGVTVLWRITMRK